jgi:divalent metal cation (Fe/Co/Zn/Cd) transporter
VALLAETTHNLLDPTASLSVTVRPELSHRRARDFRRGLEKAKNVVALLIAIGMFLMGHKTASDASSASRPCWMPDE